MDKRKTALVTGGGRGIGRGIATVLSKEGYDVAISYNSSASGAEEAVRIIEENGVRAFSVQGNVRKIEDIDKIVNKTLEEFGKIDLLVNNAGVTRGGKFLEIEPELIAEVFETDFRAPYLIAQRVARSMVEKGIKGSIINITSNQQQGIFSGSSVYGSIKAALMKFTKHAALELARYGIRVNAVAPGFTDIHSRGLDAMKPFVCPRLPLGRYATVEEIGHAVAFLASEKAGNITGTCLLVDAGSVLPMYTDRAFYQYVNERQIDID